MFRQNELREILEGTLQASSDQCQVGRLRLPKKDSFLRKRTHVLTTSREVHRVLHGRWCDNTHEHQTIEGTHNQQGNRQNISAFAAAYTSCLARNIVRALLLSMGGQEDTLLVEELLAGFEENEGHKRPGEPREAALGSLQLKRRRCGYKQPCPEVFKDEETWEQILQDVSKGAPRVGSWEVTQGELFDRVARKLKDMNLGLFIACRGTDRYRIPKNGLETHDLPLRRTVYVHRTSGEVVDVGPPQEWLKMSKLKRVGACGPARLSLTMFGSPKDVVEEVSTREELTQVERKPEGSELDHNVGWAPRPIAVSGPAFTRLKGEDQGEIRRLHHNLGHPTPELFEKFMKERGASREILEGIADFQCPTCAEHRKGPSTSRPGRIHRDLDFNDEVGGDGAYWKNAKGKVFHFMHFIDEGTLYHTGAPGGRSVDEQIRLFEDCWLQWAGPCKLLYLDPAGEYVNDAWATFLQKENIRVSMSAGESHWQLGRCERHGAIIKNMLTRMDNETPIDTEEEFRRCLRQVFNAKNSLSRIGGFTPEQALLGKSRSIPGSLMSDEEAGSHAIADCDSTEGQLFRRSLLRREQARKSFITADNDSSFRRALLRRSRPDRMIFEKGDWVLYWRRQKGGGRSERGRWHGPSQVVAVENEKIIWVSHCGRLIRASPEQLRPASLREYMSLPRGSDGGVIDDVPRDGNGPRDFVALDDVPPEVGGGVGSQPESEVSHPDTPPASEYTPTEPMEVEAPVIPEDTMDEPMDASEVPIPVETDDELFVFGYEHSFPSTVCPCYEISFHAGPTMTIDARHGTDVCFVYDTFVISNARKEKVEVRWNDLNEADRAKFSQAKEKEIKAWLNHETVKRVTQGTLRQKRSCDVGGFSLGNHQNNQGGSVVQSQVGSFGLY